jgi:hypothetical protein
LAGVNYFFRPAVLIVAAQVDLAARGFDVIAITSRQRYDDPSADMVRNEAHGSVNIQREETRHFGRENLGAGC